MLRYEGEPFEARIYCIRLAAEQGTRMYNVTRNYV
jgi:hypothetical protein